MSMKLNRFIINSRYASLKNDTQSNTLSVTITSGTTFSPSTGNILGTANLDVGTINAGIRARGKSSRYSSWSVGTTIYSLGEFSIPSIPTPTFNQTLYCTLERTSATNVRLTVAVEKSPSPDYRIEADQTITFVFSTFLSPFN